MDFLKISANSFFFFFFCHLCFLDNTSKQGMVSQTTGLKVPQISQHVCERRSVQWGERKRGRDACSLCMHVYVCFSFFACWVSSLRSRLHLLIDLFAPLYIYYTPSQSSAMEMKYNNRIFCLVKALLALNCYTRSFPRGGTCRIVPAGSFSSPKNNTLRVKQMAFLLDMD